MSLLFKSEIQIREGNPYILVSAQRAQKIKANWKKPLPVLVQINGQPKPPWRINMMPVGNGEFYLYLHGDVRKASQTKVSDQVEVSLEFDEEYKNGPQHPMPDWFWSELQKSPTALQHWEELPPSRQKEILRYFSWLRSNEAKDRNVKQALHVLSGKPGRFMARSWKDGQ